MLTPIVAQITPAGNRLPNRQREAEGERGGYLSAASVRDLRTLYTEYLLLEQRYVMEIAMEYRADGLAVPDEVDCTSKAIAAELERRANLYRRCQDPSWPDAKGQWYEQLLEQARELKAIWPVDRFMTVVVGVDLKPAGHQRLRGLCPFHGDRNPSLTVSLDYNTLRCWSCGATGDIFQATGLYFAIDAFPDQVGKVAAVTGSMMSSARIVVESHEHMQRDIEKAVHV